jgi:hypothetical protein
MYSSNICGSKKTLHLVMCSPPQFATLLGIHG